MEDYLVMCLVCLWLLLGCLWLLLVYAMVATAKLFQVGNQFMEWMDGWGPVDVDDDDGDAGGPTGGCLPGDEWKHGIRPDGG